jgi:hypothetical protein
MKPVEFKQQNIVIAKDQKPYIPLPAHVGDNGQAISCWGLTLRERIYLLFTGRLWLSVLTFGRPLQPLKLMAADPFEPSWIERCGLSLGAIAPEVDKLEAVPEFMRAWYAEDPATKKFKLDHSKVDVEDVTGLKKVAENERRNSEDKIKKVREEYETQLKQFDGIDPVKTRELLSQFASEEERKMIQAGHIDKVMEARTQKMREELMSQAQTAGEERDGALEVASTLMEHAIDNKVRAAATNAGMFPGAIEDALLRARQIFSLNDELKAVQFEEDGETVVLNKEGKAPFSVEDWIEERRADCPHWFPAGGSGGDAKGDKRTVRGAPDFSGLSPTDRLTKARELQAGAKR